MIKLLVTLFLGPFGIHKFMEKKMGIGIVYLFTFGIFGIGWIMDILKEAKALMYANSNKPTVYNFKVAGVSYRQEDICTLLEENASYMDFKNSNGRKVYRYKLTRKTAKLIPEPQNPHDPNAIMVMIDNVLVGYVPASECQNVKSILKSKSANSVEAELYGGDFKYVEYGDIVKEKRNIEIIIEITLK